MILLLSSVFIFASIFISILELRSKPWKITPLLVVMHGVFYFWPFYDFILEINSLEYSYFSYFNLTPTIQDAKLYLFLSSISMFTLAFVSYVNVVVVLPIKIRNQKQFGNLEVYILATSIAILVAMAARNFSGDLLVFFSPSRKSLSLSGYERKLLFVAPCLLLYVFRFSQLYTLKKFTVVGLFCLLIVFILGQRRDIAALMLFFILLIKSDGLFNVRKSIKFQYRAALFFTTLIPTLWYARSFFTQLGRGDDIINPLSLRNPIELIFGSSTTGFASYFLQQRHIDLGNIKLFHSLEQMFLVVIPRSIYPDKPSTIPQVIKFSENDIGNISNFFINEAYMNFHGGLFIFIAFLGVCFNTLFKYSKDDNGNFSGFYLFCFANIILLFKNGWSDYIVTITMFFALLIFIRVFFGKLLRVR